jgi:hypothetical protein
MPLERQQQGALSAFAYGKHQQPEQLVWRAISMLRFVNSNDRGCCD